jgi:hypothetical protein
MWYQQSGTPHTTYDDDLAMPCASLLHTDLESKHKPKRTLLSVAQIHDKGNGGLSELVSTTCMGACTNFWHRIVCT